MCEDCKSNGPHSIAGVPISDYFNTIQRDPNNHRWRISLCVPLQAKLLYELNQHNKTPDDNLHVDTGLGWKIWKSCALNFEYDHDLGSLLRSKFMHKGKELLKKALKWGAFKTISQGKNRRLLWSNAIVSRHFGSVHGVTLWIAAQRKKGRLRAEKASKTLRACNMSRAEKAGMATDETEGEHVAMKDRPSRSGGSARPVSRGRTRTRRADV